MGGGVWIKYFIDGTNQKEEEILGWHRYDGGGQAGQEDRYKDRGENARGLTRMEVLEENRKTQTCSRG